MTLLFDHHCKGCMKVKETRSQLGPERCRELGLDPDRMMLTDNPFSHRIHAWHWPAYAEYRRPLSFA